MSDPAFPTPEEIQRRLQELLRTGFGPGAGATPAAGAPAPDAAGGEEPPKTARDPLEFHFRPKEIKFHLDRFIIRQEEAKKVLAIAVCDHYNHVRFLRDLEREDPARAAMIEHAKQNVALLGPTGVGKTYLVRHVADFIGVPFVKADATKFSETGYVGGDVDDLVRELVQKADGDVGLAQYGIIYIDEIDKIASAAVAGGRDVSGRGVQTALLKLMEETEVPLRSPMDIQGQLQAAFEMQRGGKPAREGINTRNILFIVSGAFERLRLQVEKRLKQSSIGFTADAGRIPMGDELFRHVATQDFVEFGFEPEFIGRLPVRVALEELSAADLFDILKRSEGSLVHQYRRAFAAYGIEAEFEDEALRRIAEMAAKEKTGARGILTVCERLLRDFKYHLPDSGVARLVIDAGLVSDPPASLERLRAQGRNLKSACEAGAVREYASTLECEGLRVVFEDTTVEALVELAGARGVGVRALCEELFHDFPYGLRLIRRTAAHEELRVPPEAVAAPDKWLSDLVVKSHRSG